jgi:hypothetical protein
MKQYLLTTAAGKRLIAKGMAAHLAVMAAARQGRLVIVAGTTNGYVAEEVLGALGQAEGFSRAGYRRGLTVAPGAKALGAEFPGDVVIQKGVWQRGQTIYDAVASLRAGDVVLKGANAYDDQGMPAVQIGHTEGGTILEALRALIGRRVQLIVPVGLEKRVPGSLHALALKVNAPDCSGPRLIPFPGAIYTELDALRQLTGAEAVLLAAGGILGAEGSAWLGVEGDPAQMEAAEALIRSVAHEPPCVA